MEILENQLKEIYEQIDLIGEKIKVMEEIADLSPEYQKDSANVDLMKTLNELKMANVLLDKTLQKYEK